MNLEKATRRGRAALRAARLLCVLAMPLAWTSVATAKPIRHLPAAGAEALNQCRDDFEECNWKLDGCCAPDGADTRSAAERSAHKEFLFIIDVIANSL